jgi:hypothetical protein
MLTWQIEAGWANTTSLEYGAIMAIPIKRLLEISEGVCVMELPSYYIAKVHKNLHCTHHLRRYVTLESQQIDLCKKQQFSNNTCTSK